MLWCCYGIIYEEHVLYVLKYCKWVSDIGNSVYEFYMFYIAVIIFFLSLKVVKKEKKKFVGVKRNILYYRYLINSEYRWKLK